MASRLTGTLSRFIGDHTRAAFALLRRVRPLIATRRIGVVSRADDVRAVLADHERFTVGLYEPKMTAITGPFILGLDDTPLYRREHAALRTAIRADDLPALAEATLSAARERVAVAVGQIDVVAELADPVADEVIAGYFGTPGPDTATQLRWARSIFEDIFLNVGDKPATHARALADAGEMRPHLDALIAERRARIDEGARVPDDVLTRLLRAASEDGGLRPIAIRHNLIGLIAGWIPTVSKAFACAIEELLRRPADLARAQAAARAGDRDLVAAHVFEALRFRPQTWALLRLCEQDVAMAGGTRRATTFRAGSRVLVATQSAMFDPRVVRAPREFRVDRPWSDYLHFGHGLHACFGQEINRVHLPAMATALLEGPPLTRAGKLSWDGPYPASLRVAYVPGGS
ncbi:MAG: cytochrome P450 [Solirubrobacteraceae bacterium]